jgi:serine/threonine protein kinase
MTKTLNKYELIEKIGEGATKTVWKAHDTIQERDVALKIYDTKHIQEKYPNSLEAIVKNEAIALTKLGHHPHIAEIYDANFDSETNQFYIAEELIEGQTLLDWLNQNECNNRKSIRKAKKYFKQIVKGLKYLESKKIVHKDLKLENIIIGKDSKLKITDFGSALIPGLNPTTKGSILYSSPEQITGESLTPATNTWQLGVIMYRVLTGEFPFTSSFESWDVLSQGQVELQKNELRAKIKKIDPKDPDHINPTISNSLSRIVMNCLNKKPHKRQSMNRLTWRLSTDNQASTIIGGLLLGSLAGAIIIPWMLGRRSTEDYMLYISQSSGGTEIHTIDINGLGLGQVTNNSFTEKGLSVANYGEVVVYSRGRGENWDLILRTPTGRESRIDEAMEFGDSSWKKGNNWLAIFSREEIGTYLSFYDKIGSRMYAQRCPFGKELKWHPSGEYLSFIHEGKVNFIEMNGDQRIADEYGENVIGHEWTGRGLLVVNSPGGKPGDIKLYSKANEEFSSTDISEIAQVSENIGLKLTSLRDDSGFFYLLGDLMYIHKFDEPEPFVININQDPPNWNPDVKIEKAIESHDPGMYFLMARFEDLDGSGTVDSEDNIIAQVFINKNKYSIRKYDFVENVQELVYIPPYKQKISYHPSEVQNED